MFKRLIAGAAVVLATIVSGGLAAAQTSSFPTSQDTLCDPTPTQQTNAVGCGHAELHTAENDAIEALERKVGTGASTPQAGQYLGSTGTGSSGWTTLTPVPTDTPRPTDTPAPTATLRPTDTPAPTATQEAQGFDFSTATPATGCIESAVSTSQVDCVAPATAITPAPTATPRATDTPIPAVSTATPRATDTPIPADTLVPTATREARGYSFSTATPVVNCLLDAVSSSQVDCVANGTAVTPAPTATPRATDTPAPTATPQTGASSTFIMGFGDAALIGIGAGQTFYVGPDGPNATENKVAVPIPAITWTKLYAKSVETPGVSQTYTFTLRKNAADTAVTCNYTGSNTSCNDTAHSVAFTAGDTLDVSVVLSGGATTLNSFAVSVAT